MKILVLGVTGMLGSAMFRAMAETNLHEVWGTARRANATSYFSTAQSKYIKTGIEVTGEDVLAALFNELKPSIVINCIGLVKQLAAAGDPRQADRINTKLPHQLLEHCNQYGARLVHISTDCVFSGKKGNYVETDLPDAEDVYGRSKMLGEVNAANAITLRTSIIGHELETHHSLIGWFLAQQGEVKGYRRSIFSGLPAVELARIVRDVVLPRPELHGLYHVASQPISKYELLTLVAQVYNKSIRIIPDETLIIDRSLNAKLFQDATGYHAPGWPTLIARMREFG